MSKDLYGAAESVMRMVVQNEAKTAVKYVDTNFVIRATRRLFNGKLPAKSDPIVVLVTIGKPNYREREFIKDCKKAKEKFPIKGVVLTFPPVKRKKK